MVVILIDRIDLAAARAIQYARTLMPDDLRAVHFNIDNLRAEVLMERWQRVGLTRLPLDVIDCPDRRLGRAALELAAELADGETEVSMLLPRRSYGRAWRRILHDQTADQHRRHREPAHPRQRHHRPLLVAPGIEERSHRHRGRCAAQPVRDARRAAPAADDRAVPRHGDGHHARSRSCSGAHPARVAGRVKTVRVQPWSGVPTLQCVLVDGSGEAITLVFLGRRSIPGIRNGTRMVAEAMVGKHDGKLAMINPIYELTLGARAIEPQRLTDRP